MSDAKKAKVSPPSEDEDEDEDEDEECKFFIGDLPSELFSKIVKMYMDGAEKREERINRIATLRLVSRGSAQPLLKAMCNEAVKMSDEMTEKMVDLPHTEFVMSWMVGAVGMSLYNKIMDNGSPQMCLDAVKLMKPIHRAKNHKERLLALADALDISDAQERDVLVETMGNVYH
jgi:hypothetical protein